MDDFSTIQHWVDSLQSIPGSSLVLDYVRSSYQNDPFRIVLELFLVFFAARYMLGKRYKIDDNAVKLTDKEIDELVDEWRPEPLVPPKTPYAHFELSKIPTISGPQGPKTKVMSNYSSSSSAKTLINLASSNYLGLANNEVIKHRAIDTLNKYGLGSCGPPGFYGTIDVHMTLERDIAAFLGVPEAIIYSQGFSTISSVIPAFSKRGDILVVDDGVNFAIQKGVQISRSIIKKFKHNDMQDLERVLLEIKAEDAKHKKRLTRRFIVTEGLFQNHGDIAPLLSLLELKKKYKYRLILDESQSFGTVGKRGGGITDLFGVPATEVDMIVGSMSTALCSAGGFCAGSHEIIDHQRLSGSAYCFSASLPAMLAVSASEGLHILAENPTILTDLQERATALRMALSHPSLDRLIMLHSADINSHAPFFHIRVHPDYITSRLRDTELDITREDEERLLQEVVDEAMHNGVLLTRAKYVVKQEMDCPRPSIRLCATAALSKKEADKAGTVVRAAIIKVFSKWRK